MKTVYVKTGIVTALVFSFTGGSLALAAGHGGMAGAFLRVGIGADRVGMGDCGAALVGGAMNWYYNPGSLPFQRSPQAAVGYRAMSLDRSLMYAGFATPLEPNAGLALGVLRAGTGNIDARDSNGEPLDKLSQSDNLIHGSFALKPHRNLALGLSIKWMISAVPDVLDDGGNLYAYAMGLDVGALLTPLPQLRFGAQLRDINATYSWDSSDVWGDQVNTKEDRFPNLLRVGAAFEPLPVLTLAADLVVDTDNAGESDGLSPRVGAEYRHGIEPGRSFALRVGWNGVAPTFGFGVDLDLRRFTARLDYAFVVEQVSPSGSHLITWVLGL